MFAYSQQRLTTGLVPDIKISDTSITGINTFEFLGRKLGENLKWKSHINKIANKILKSYKADV